MSASGAAGWEAGTADITGTNARDTLTGPAGADTVIDMGGGAQMILVGVQTSSLTGAWIFES